jgi:peptide chain release factor 2
LCVIGYNKPMQELVKRLQTLEDQVAAAITKLDLEARRSEAEALEAEALAPDFWANPDVATKKSQRLASLKRTFEPWFGLHEEVTGALELTEMGDTSLSAELEETAARLEGDYAAREFELKLSGPHDKAAAIVEIHAGTGGTDAQDWTAMLERMYLRYAERAGFSTEVVSLSAGEEAGIKSVTFEVNGPYAYGLLKGEKGVHRLVRLSPFNSDNLRQTSFALVEVVPQLEQATDITIDPKDLRIDVFRSGGHGGQSVNTTDSAVRITHIPTGVVVAIQNERSQLQNREKAMGILKSRLVTLMEAEHKAELSELRGATQSAEWGSQIRSYVLHPYTMVKDHRTAAETSQVQAVLDGDIDAFIEAYLQSQIGN